jgi:hypothetical protein
MYQGQDDHWYAFFWRAPHCSCRGLTTHKAARIIIGTAREMGIPLRAWQDHRISTSERWLSRLGFKPTGDFIKGEWAIWQIQ